VAVLIVAVTAFVFAGKKYVASLYYYRAVVAAAADPDKASAPLMRAIAWDGGGNDEYWRARSQLLVAQLKREAGKEGGGNQATVQQFAISAIDAAQQATVRNEMSPLNWNNLASVYEELSPVAGGAETFALANYQKVKELDPVNPQSYVNSARVHFASAQQKKAAGAPSEEIEKSLDDAQGDLQRALELKKDYGVAHFAYMQILLGRGRMDEITGRVDLLRSLDPFDPALAYEIGIFAFQNNLMEIAQAEFERAVGLKEDYANARFYLSLIYEAQGKRDEAIAQLERVKELNPDNVMINEMIEKARAGQPIIASPSPAPDETED
jgi:tetratricopeptide (TPR) repeat protein